MNTRKASGRASALRVNRATPSTTIFKTRCQPCRIAVRAGSEKSMHSTGKRPRFGAICTSFSADRCRILPTGAVTLLSKR